MKWSKVELQAFGYELGPEIISSEELEETLAPVYEKLRIPFGQLEAWTGIEERRWWPKGASLVPGAVTAARRALAKSNVTAADIGAIVYTGVCREQYEPATACAIASEIGVSGEAFVYDISNACLGALNGVIDIANRIELGQIRAGLVVSCESSRDIMNNTIDRLKQNITMDAFKMAIATMTGGSGAIAILLTDGSFDEQSTAKVKCAVHCAEPQFHRLCLWELEPQAAQFSVREKMTTDSVAVLKNGVALGLQTWRAFLRESGLNSETIDKVICHQVGSGHRDAIMKTLELDPKKEYTSYEFLGNMGTVSLPLTAALASERGFIRSQDNVAFLGIGSGLNCLMMALEWN